MAEVEELIGKGESETVEFKAKFDNEFSSLLEREQKASSTSPNLSNILYEENLSTFIIFFSLGLTMGSLNHLNLFGL